MRYPALTHRNFRIFLVAGFISNVGTWMQNVARSWVVYRSTNDDPRWLGWLGLAFAVPMVILPPVGGAIVDRVHRVRLVVVTQICMTLVAVGLTALAFLHVLAPWHLVASTFVGAVLLAIDNPARQALAPDLVPRKDLLNALSLNAASFTGAALVGPAIAGPLLDQVGPGWLFLLNAVSFLFMIAAVLDLRDLPEHARRAPATRRGSFAEAVAPRGVVSLLVVSAMLALFGRSYPMLLPITARHVFGGGAGSYGRLLAAGGAGAILGAFGTATFPVLRASSRTMLVSTLVLAASLVGFAFAPGMMGALACLVVVSAASTVLTTGIATTLQHATEPHARGRVMSLYVVTLIGLPQMVAPLLAKGAAHFAVPRAGIEAVLVSCAVLLVAGVATTLGTKKLPFDEEPDSAQ